MTACNNVNQYVDTVPLEKLACKVFFLRVGSIQRAETRCGDSIREDSVEEKRGLI